MKANSLRASASFTQMIEAHGEQALFDSFLFKRPSVRERMDEGKSLRKQVARSAQATYDVRPDRPDPIEILERQAATRIPKLVPVRYGRMSKVTRTRCAGPKSLMAGGGISVRRGAARMLSNQNGSVAIELRNCFDGAAGVD